MAAKDIEKYQFTSEQSRTEAAENGKKGGLQKGINNKKRKAFKEYIESELDKETVIDGVTVTVKEATTMRLVSLLLDENISVRDFLKAFEIIREQLGEKPIEKYELNTIDAETVAEVERLVQEALAE